MGLRQAGAACPGGDPSLTPVSRHAHPFWLHCSSLTLDRTIQLDDIGSALCACTEAKKCGLRMGLREEQLVQHGLPIRPAFSNKMPPKKKLRATLGINHPQPAVLLVGMPAAAAWL